MTTIVVDELKAVTLSQPITVSSKIVSTGVRLNLFKYLSPAGTFTCSIKQSSTTIGSKALTSALIEAGDTNITNINYTHGYILFQFAGPVVLNPGDYTIELSSSGYTFSEAAYIGWVVPHEDIKTGITYTPGDDLQNPYGLELWEFKEF